MRSEVGSAVNPNRPDLPDLVCTDHRVPRPDRAAHDHRHAGRRAPGRALRELPASVTVTVRMRADAALHQLPPPRTGKPGRPRSKGDRLPELIVIAALTATRWQPALVRRYGRTDRVELAVLRCLWPGCRHPPGPGRAGPPTRRTRRLRPGAGHHRPGRIRRRAGRTLRRQMEHRGLLRRGSPARRRRPGPQPQPARRIPPRAHRRRISSRSAPPAHLHRNPGGPGSMGCRRTMNGESRANVEGRVILCNRAAPDA
jgi:hypothetical protein